MEKEFTINVVDDITSESIYEGLTVNYKTLHSKNGRIELNDLKTINKLLSLIYNKSGVPFDTKLDVSPYTRILRNHDVSPYMQHHGYEVVSYILTPIGRSDNYSFSTLESFLKYCGINYNQVTNFDYSGTTWNNGLSYPTIKVPLQIRRRELNSPFPDYVPLETMKEESLFKKTMEYVMKSIGFK